MRLSAKEYLSQAYTLKRAIDWKHEQIAQLQAMARRATSVFEAVRIGGTSNRSKVEDSIIKIDGLCGELAALMSEFSDTYREISAAVAAVNVQKYRELLGLRYLSFLNWEEVADKMGYTYRHVMRTHGEALKCITVPNMSLYVTHNL